MRNKIKLVAFDLDGVLVDGGGSWTCAHNGLGTLEASRINGEAYFSGIISFEEWAERDVSLWKGVEIERLKEILYASELMPGIEDTLRALKKKYKIAIISGGLKLLADRVMELYDLDYSFGNELLVRNGIVAGMKQAVDFHGKGKILSGIAEKEGITTKQCAAVGDYLNDIPMFKVAGLSIAFNPKDESVARCADAVVEGKDLRRILEYLG
ncbi:MAG: HAD family phosphatase [Candidatus Altiarchaeia archaeon]